MTTDFMISHQYVIQINPFRYGTEMKRVNLL